MVGHSLNVLSTINQKKRLWVKIKEDTSRSTAVLVTICDINFLEKIVNFIQSKNIFFEVDTLIGALSSY